MRAAARPLAFALLCLVWGSTWLVIKVGYGGLGPFNVAAIRFLVAGAVMAALVPLMRARWPSTREEWTLAMVVGVALFAGDYGLIYWGEQRLDSGTTAVVFAISPLTTALLAHLYLPGERATPRKLGGTLVAFLGVVALFAGSVRVDATLALPVLAIVGAAVCASIGSVATKRHGATLHAAGLNAPAMLVGGALLLLVSWATGESPRLPKDAATWEAIAYLALAGSVVTFLLYFWLLKTWAATTMSLIAVVVPLVALVLGYAALRETPTAWTGLGAALILAGVVLALGKPKRVL